MRSCTSEDICDGVIVVVWLMLGEVHLDVSGDVDDGVEP